MRLYILYILIACSCLLQGCASGVNDSSGVSFPSVLPAKWEPLNPYPETGAPVSMATDGSDVYVMSHDGGSIVQRFSITDGNMSGRFGSMGQGPGELVSPVNCSISEGMLTLYDSSDNLFKTIRVSDSSFVGTAGIPCSGVVNEAYVMDGGIIGVGPGRKLDLFQSGSELTASYTELPTDENNINEWYDLQAHTAVEGNRFYYATLLGGFLESFIIENGGFRLVRRVRMPGCDVPRKANGRIDYKAVAAYGFTALCANERYCFGAFSGSENPDAKSRVGVWTPDLQPVVCLETDKLVVAMCASDSELISVTHTDDTGYMLERISLASLNLGND